MATTDTLSLIEVGRQALLNWEGAKPANFFTCDEDQQLRLRMYLGDETYAQWEPRYAAFGGQCAGEINAAAIENNRDENLPTLRRYSNLGTRTEEVVHHPLYRRIGDLTWASGVMAGYATPGQELAQMNLFYLSAQNGEAGHNCPLACTAGLIKAVQALGNDAMKKRWLPGLLSTKPGEYLRGAQFLTEVQGGSDVGANASVAAQDADGTWRISGEKWFCSVADADLFLVTARAKSNEPGTRGLGMFLVPRHLDDGSVNGLHFRRLKYKLGTRSMASGELDFIDAVAYPIGPLDGAFRNTMTYVITTSRLYNATTNCGMMRRAQLEAQTYAQHRTAFDHVILQYPLVQDAIARTKVAAQATTASTFYLLHLGDRIVRGEASEMELATFRLGVSANKYRASYEGTSMVRDAMDVLAGNGTIEDFSVLPRLLRDSLVCEMWEGAHNVLAQQALRDMQKMGVHTGFFACMHALLDTVGDTAFHGAKAEAARLLDRTAARVERVLTGDMRFAARHARAVLHDLASVLQLVCLLREAQWQRFEGVTTDKPDVVDHFIHQHAHSGDAMDDDTLAARVERLVAAF